LRVFRAYDPNICSAVDREELGQPVSEFGLDQGWSTLAQFQRSWQAPSFRCRWQNRKFTACAKKFPVPSFSGLDRDTLKAALLRRIQRRVRNIRNELSFDLHSGQNLHHRRLPPSGAKQTFHGHIGIRPWGHAIHSSVPVAFFGDETTDMSRFPNRFHLFSIAVPADTPEVIFSAAQKLSNAPKGFIRYIIKALCRGAETIVAIYHHHCLSGREHRGMDPNGELLLHT